MKYGTMESSSVNKDEFSLGGGSGGSSPGNAILFGELSNPQAAIAGAIKTSVSRETVTTNSNDAAQLTRKRSVSVEIEHSTLEVERSGDNGIAQSASVSAPVPAPAHIGGKNSKKESRVVPIDKKFKCLHPGCGKMFNRKDYLARHSANHLEVRPYQCPICPSQFARQDLLEKHMTTKTHEKRQKREALQRMSSYSNNFSYLVFDQSQKTAQSQSSASSTVSSPLLQQQQSRLQSSSPTGDKSSPKTIDSSQAPSQHVGSELKYYQLPPPSGSPSLPSISNLSSDRPSLPLPSSSQVPGGANTLNAPGTIRSLPLKLLYDQPGQQQSLSLPASVVTPSNGNVTSILDSYATVPANSATQQRHSDILMEPSSRLSSLSALSKKSNRAVELGDATSSSAGSTIPVSAESSVAVNAGIDLTPFSLDSFDFSLSDHYAWLFGSDFWTDSSSNSTSVAAAPSESIHNQVPPSPVDMSILEPIRMPDPVVSAKSSDIRTSPLSERKKIENSDLTAEVHERMLEVLKPIAEVTTENPYFSLTAVKRYLNLYWVHFDPLYPILHRSTFDPSVMDPALLISIVTIGMAYSSDSEASLLAISIHKKFRNIVFLMIEDQPQVQLWVHQTLLLTNYFDKMLGSTVQYDMSQFFHGTNIALMHFSGYLKGLTEPPVNETYDVATADTQWREWVIYETTKRTAFFAFTCDTQHATLFRHSPILSAFEVRLDLPCTDACWAASDGIEFIRMYKEQYRIAQLSRFRIEGDNIPVHHFPSHLKNPEMTTQSSQFRQSQYTGSDPSIKQQNMLAFGGQISGTTPEGLWPSFLHSLKRLIRLSKEDQKKLQFSCFSQFSCLILLHGLLSICWDMQWRGLLDMGIVSKRRMTEFKDRLESSFDNWKSYIDYQLAKSNLPPIGTAVVFSPPHGYGRFNSFLSPSFDDSANSKGYSDTSFDQSVLNDYVNNSPLLCSNWAMFQLGLLALHVDTMNLRINAGSPNVLGRKIRAIDREISNKAVHSWARSEDGRLATWNSVQFMRRIAENESLLDQAVHIPWGVYLTTLTIWSYETCMDDDSVPPPGCGHKYSKHRYSDRNNRKYLSINGQSIESGIAKQDAIQYLRSMNINGEFDYHSNGKVSNHDSSSGIRTSQPNQSTDVDRKQLVIGLVAYSTYLLMQIKWGFVARGREVLNNILKEY
ncbi:fungal-specific transcription factor domain-containing protein, partial [Dipodascopsis uninucleata]